MPLRTQHIPALLLAVALVGCGENSVAPTDPDNRIRIYNPGFNPPPPRTEIVTVAEPDLRVAAHWTTFYRIRVIEPMREAVLSLDVLVANKQSVEIFVFDAVQYANWRALVGGKSLYTSGRVAAAKETVALGKPDTYYAVLLNSTATDVSLALLLTLSYKVGE